MQRFTFSGRVVFALGALAALSVHAAAPADEAGLQISPPHWWAKMAEPQLQLMVHAPDVAHASVRATQPDLNITATQALDSANYLFVDVDLRNTRPGDYTLEFVQEGQVTYTHTYTIAAREKGSAQRQGFDQTDTIYLVTPDRFANGDTSNDQMTGYAEGLDRSAPGGRHGGDIQGMLAHLDYIAEMGFTQIWSMPLLENAMDAYSYHGYSTTDYYQIDPRYGSNALYRKFSDAAAEQDIGIIMDMVLNHIGSGHLWMTDKPALDWIINNGEFTPTTHRREVLHDPHGVLADEQAFSNGWFVPTMPDLNQQNPYLANYLIQNAIWWVEYANLSGIRVDTYSYSDKDFLSQWTTRLMQEYPNLNIVGEEWTTNPVITAYWQAGSYRADGYESALPSVMDFPLQATLVDALTQDESWGTGLVSLYNLLAGDFIYGDPYNLVIFGDNHDMSRIYTQLDESYPLWDMAMTFLLTARGIPQVYYGTELLMANPDNTDHGIIRQDFPGGWPNDSRNGFSGEGLDPQQQKAQQRMKSLLSLRQAHPVVTQGQFVHYVPKDGVYVYFREGGEFDESAMVVLNKNSHEVTLDLARFVDQLGHAEKATHWGSQTQTELADGTLSVSAQSAGVWLIQ